MSDILKLLDKAPIWKTLTQTPKQIAELEARVAALEAKPREAEHLHTCGQCGQPASVTAVRDHPTFGVFGKKIRTITCQAGHAIEYDWKPE
ncbi:hypothetical protein [uncultured Sulfitobacter sp.]|uniref:hypothetical protein n=1 Tax=uncultured Sulfitobacter sp. TaxID=191468 RepID=UPI00262516EE|nr:hypothetical protein [uncultured Sulfitobacter sp.]